MLYSNPPPLRPFSEAKPTLLVSWWTTLFCTCIILLRLAGRYVRVEKLFREDKIVALALVPLFLRMGCAHVVLFWGTNNVELDGATLSDAELSHRVAGSQFILAGRVLYTATLWTLKLTTLEFVTRLAGAYMKEVYLGLIMFLRYALGVSFVAVLVIDLAECHPFREYWQVTPDPGGQCRQGFVQLLTMGAVSAVMDILLIVFPVSIILSTRIPTQRKILLAMLFCFGFITVGITLYQVPRIIQLKGDQIFRSMWASITLLTATTVSNIVALGSFLRDSGAKKMKFCPGYHSSGATFRGRDGVTTGATWEDLEHAKAHQQLKTESGEWLNKADPRPRKEFMRKMNPHSSQFSGEIRGPSPMASHDSLMRQDRSCFRGTIALDLPAPKPPPVAIVASSGGFYNYMIVT